MLQKIILYIAFILTVQTVSGQNDYQAFHWKSADSIPFNDLQEDRNEPSVINHAKVYTINKSVDIPVTAACAAWTLYGFSQVSKKGDVTLAQVNSLKKSNVDWFDRWAMYPYSKSIDQLSYVPFYVAMPLPLAVMAVDGKLRKDFVTLSFLYLESLSFTGVFYSSAVHYVSRFRPLVYSPESPDKQRTVSNSRNSFFAGHVALVGTSSFFAAQILADYHPNSPYKWVYYSVAGGLTAITAYWRSHAGEHFPSDILVGSIIGPLSGILTPRLHRMKIVKSQRLSIFPFSGRSQGLAMLYKL